MAQPVTKFTSPVSLAVDAVLIVAFFVLIYTFVSPHVPSMSLASRATTWRFMRCGDAIQPTIPAPREWCVRRHHLG